MSRNRDKSKLHLTPKQERRKAFFEQLETLNRQASLYGLTLDEYMAKRAHERQRIERELENYQRIQKEIKEIRDAIDTDNLEKLQIIKGLIDAYMKGGLSEVINYANERLEHEKNSIGLDSREN